MSVASQLLQQVRRRAELTQAELARRAGFTRSVVNAYERGARDPGTTALAALAAAAGFELSVRPAPLDLAHNGRVLVTVLGLADALPQRRRGPLRFPPVRG